MTAPHTLQPATRLALTVAMLRIEAQLTTTLQPSTVAEVLTLAARAEYDLEQGWNEAAIDCIGRAERLLSEPTEETHP